MKNGKGNPYTSANRGTKENSSIALWIDGIGTFDVDIARAEFFQQRTRPTPGYPAIIEQIGAWSPRRLGCFSQETVANLANRKGIAPGIFPKEMVNDVPRRTATDNSHATEPSPLLDIFK